MNPTDEKTISQLWGAHNLSHNMEELRMLVA